MKLILSAGARADLKRLRDFLAGKNPEAAQRAIELLAKALLSLQDQPHRGRPVGIAGMRERIVPFGRTAYVIRYFVSVRHDALVVLRIWHGREDR